MSYIKVGEKDNVFCGIFLNILTHSQDATEMMNALQINQIVEEESALKVCYNNVQRWGKG